MRATARPQERLLLAAIEAYAERHHDHLCAHHRACGRDGGVSRQARVEAVPYHGKMETAERAQNQERWMSDEARVLVGTIAFGLGIDKPAVRAVIHLALPKSIEQYYPGGGTGRARWRGRRIACCCGRCAMPGLLAYFNGKIPAGDERQRAWESYHAIRRFAESDECRHRQICLHFGETPKWEKCNACDVCADEPGWMLAPEPRRAASGVPESALQQYMREWRRGIAKQRGVPAFMILTDTSLADLCAREPSTFEELTGSKWYWRA